MAKKILQLLRQRPEFALVTLALFLSNLGSGMTQVALYTRLAEAGASSGAFAVAFALAVFPGLFVGGIAARLAVRRNWAGILGGAQLLGAVGIIPALVGAMQHSIPLFLSAEFAAALTAGISYPLQQSLIKRLFKDEELSAILRLDTVAFALTVLLGIGAGSLLIAVVGATNYVILDLLSYLAAAAAIGVAFKLRPLTFAAPAAAPGTVPAADPAPTMSADQRRAFLILPVLALVGTPAMSLLPFAAGRFTHPFVVFGLPVAPAVAFVFAKGLGQLLGPMVVPHRMLEPLTKGRAGLWVALVLFTAAYCAALSIPSAPVSLGLVMLAHVASNIVFVVGIYSVQRAFDAAAIARVSSLQYRTQVAVMTAASLGAGYLVKLIPAPAVVIIALVVGAVAQWTLSHFSASKKGPVNHVLS